MRAVITVVGKDMVGILSSVSDRCAKNQVNIIEVSQSILQEMFCMIMLVDVSGCTVPFTAFAEEIRLEQQPDGSSEKPACTLYYSDGKQQQKKLDQETAKQLRAYFTELALCLLDEQP